MKNKPIYISITDDHTLFRKGIISLLHALNMNIEIVLESNNGNDFINKLPLLPILPQLAIMDMNMPGRNGYDTVTWLNANYPDIKVLIISMVDSEEEMLRMLKVGVKGYLSKDVEPNNLKEAINSILEKGFYYTDFITGKLLHGLQKNETPLQYLPINLTEKEKEMLVLFCTELSHKEIAAQLSISVKTVDHYRENLCKKLNAISRIGLVLYAMKHRII
jgi:DNA-binding NarL/FixJ family response regulator